MSDALSALVARNLGLGEPTGQVLPRPVARFEQPDGLAGLIVPDGTSDQTPPSTAADSPGSAATPPTAGHLQRGRLDQPGSPSTLPATNPAGSLTADARTPTDPPTSRPPLDTSGQPISLIEPTSLLPTTIIIEPARDQGSTTGQLAISPAPDRPPPPDAAGRSVWSATPTLAPRPEADADRRPSEPPPPAVTIEVTIGRIEVMPPTPAPPARPPAPRRPPMQARPVRSLDDVLTRRREVRP